MHYKKLLILGLSCLLGCSFPMTVVASENQTIVSEAEPVSYDTRYSILKLTFDEPAYFSYKVDGNYPVYSKDIVYYFNEDGSLREKKEGMLGQPKYTDDVATWIDASKTTPQIEDTSDYYDCFMRGDGELVLPYTKEQQSGQFYIPVTKANSTVTICIYKGGKVQTHDFIFTGYVKPSEPVVEIKSINKTPLGELIQISGDKIKYVELGRNTYFPSENLVSIFLTSNGEKVFNIVTEGWNLPITKKYTVDGLTDTKLRVVSDKTAPVISYSGLPTEKVYRGFDLKITTDDYCSISCNGVSSKGKEFILPVTGNGTYRVVATNQSGMQSEKLIQINCFGDGKVTTKQEFGELDRDAYWGKNVKR